METPVAETVDNARRQQGPVADESENVGPHRRGISGDMERRGMRKLEKSSVPGEETSPRRLGL